MKEKIKSIMVISFFMISICFLSLSQNKNNKKENIIKEDNSKVTINVESKKYGLYKKLEKDIKEDYSYKEIKTIVNTVCNCKVKENKANSNEEVIKEEKDDIIDEGIENEILEEEINEEVIEDSGEEITGNDSKEEITKEDKEVIKDETLEVEKEIVDDNKNDETKVEEKIEEEDKDNIIDEIIENEMLEEDIKEGISDNSKEEITDNDSEEETEKEDVIEVGVNNNEILEEYKPILKNGFYEENGNTYYYENDKKVTGLKVIDGVNHYFSPIGKYLGTNNIKVIDVSYYQGNIDWNLFVESDYYGVILRMGYYDTLDKKFDEYIKEIKRLNIPYGIYLFSYSTTITGSLKEATFTNSVISKYNLKPTLGIYYDIESWSSKNGATSNNISKDMYDKIITNYISEVSNYVENKYKVKVYTGRWYAYNRLSSYARSYVDWVAEYNKTCKYYENYSMWQYTSKGSAPGINGNVDISYIL